ncbi:MAG: ATP-binding protein [Bacteroidota bacterium]
MIYRKITSIVLKKAAKVPVITITGPRQSGKSTLTKQAFPAHRYVNLENIEYRNLAVDDPKGFLDSFPHPVIIDEVQYAPDLISYIQIIVDEGAAPGSFILTGSQNLLLMQQVAQSLAGRVAIFNLLPFSLEELADTNYTYSNYEEYLIRGFYPRIYDKDLEAQDWYRDYITTYVERDVRQLLNIENAALFRQFIEVCAGRIGQLVNFSDIGNMIGVSYQTVKRWLSILETSFIIYTIRPYHKNYDKRIVKSPKLYFYDVGLAATLLNIQAVDQVTMHFARGALFENFILNEIQKHFLNRGKRQSLYFWQDSTKKEIDLLIDLGTTLHTLEIKSGKTINRSFFKNLTYFKELEQKLAVASYLIYGGREIQRRSDITVLGWNQLGELPI